jgi:hypothetical protein
MNLKTGNTDPIRLGDRFGWVFPMRTDDEHEVRVIVTDDALLAIGAHCVSGIPQVSGECRLRVEAIASAKYADGVMELDGSVIITQDDVH